MSGQSRHTIVLKVAPRNPVWETLIATVCPPGPVTVAAPGSILKSCLAEPVLDKLALRDRSEHLDPALGQLGADRPVAIGGVPQDLIGSLCWGRRSIRCLRTIGLASRADMHGG